MPKGIPGSGPYARTTPKGDAAEATATTTKRRTRKTTAGRKARKTATATRARSNGNGAVRDLGTYRSVSVTADGQILLEERNGTRARIRLERPSMLLDLESDAREAADGFIAKR